MIIGIIETWLNDIIQDNLINIDGFSLIRLDRASPKRGGGLLFNIHNAIDLETVPKGTYLFE